MSYTSIELLRRHLASSIPVLQKYYDQAVHLSGNNSVRFFDGAVDRDSVRVKSPRREICRIECYLSDQKVTIANNPLIAESVVVGSDTSLGRIFRENVDYVIDSHQSTIIRKTSGEITSGKKVIIWYSEYHYYQADLDYCLNHNQSGIQRLASGSIADGETVYLDYSPLYDSLDDSILSPIVNEANGLIENEIDQANRYGTNAVLQSAATSRAMELLCYTLASRSLFANSGEGKASIWLKLSDKFASRAERLLAHFHPQLTGPSGPRIS